MEMILFNDQLFVNVLETLAVIEDVIIAQLRMHFAFINVCCLTSLQIDFRPTIHIIKMNKFVFTKTIKTKLNINIENACDFIKFIDSTANNYNINSNYTSTVFMTE